MKIDREKIFKKFDGRCAYCGIQLEITHMQVDHFWPRCLEHQRHDGCNNKIDNLMPSCQKCNIHKGGNRPENWRSELGRQVTMLKKNAQFCRALRFGQIELTEQPIVFYFERLSNAIPKIL